MPKRMRIGGWFAVLLLGSVAARAEDCAALTGLKLGAAIVTQAAPVAAGASGVPGGDAKIGFCRIEVTSKPSSDSDIRIELWVPEGGAWNGKFEQVGNGGFAGSLPYRSMAHALSQGYAVAGTDDGHQAADMTDARWALHHPEKIKDFGWRAIDQTSVVSKQILHRLTARAPAHSYFVGCSDGGREALMMAQRHPSYFDGIIAGAPAYAMTRLLTGGALLSRALPGPLGHLGAAQLALLQKQVLEQCGNGRSYLEDPRQCHPDLDRLQCTATAADPCLTAAQLQTVRAIYAERKDPLDGATLFAVLPGAEAVQGSWDAWLTGADEKTSPAGLAFTWNYLAFMVMHDPKFELATVTPAELARGEREIGAIIDAVNPDLSAFKAHGGKLIQYHGWNDPAIAPGYSLAYHAQAAARTPGLQDFYRLYMVPGMLHCGGGDAPTMVDWPGLLDAWVEHGAAPDEITAHDARGGSQTLHPQ